MAVLPRTVHVDVSGVAAVAVTVARAPNLLAATLLLDRARNDADAGGVPVLPNPRCIGSSIGPVSTPIRWAPRRNRIRDPRCPLTTDTQSPRQEGDPAAQARWLVDARPHKIRFRWQPYAWILPGLAMLVVFLFYPIFFSATLSLFKWNGYTRDIFGNFVGLGNYVELAKDANFLKALFNTLLVVFFCITVQIGIALVLAIFIYLGEFRGASILRGIIFFPSVLSAVVVGIIWRNVVFLRGGLINQVTSALGLPAFFPLGDTNFIVFTIIFVAIWQGVGFNLVIFFAGLQSTQHEIIESAQIDGAGFWQVILHIITPLQAPIILVSIVLNIIGGIQIFDLVFVLTSMTMRNVHAADVLATYMLFNSFAGGQGTGGRSELGYAAAIAVVMMALMLVFAVLRTRAQRAINY